MNHDFTGQSWATHHHEASRTIGAFIRKLAYVFERLQALRYDAPWRVRAQPRPVECAEPNSRT